MLGSTKRRIWITLSGLGLLLAASVLTACAYSVTGGVAGLIVTVAMGAALLGLGTAASGCEDDVGPCLKIDLGPHDTIVPCLWVDTGACLTPNIDAGPDSKWPVEVGPCLSPPAPDVGPGPDGNVGPCLSPPAPDMGVGALEPGRVLQRSAPAHHREIRREQAIARLASRLPADVAARLGAGVRNGASGKENA